MTSPPGAPGLVHIVDDDAAVCDSLAVLLEGEGYRVLCFASGGAFLDHLDPATSGCLLTDLQMPDMTGLDLQDHLAARGIAMPVIVMTGHAEIPMAVRAIKAGAIDFIEKPFAEGIILDAVRRALAVAPPHPPGDATTARHPPGDATVAGIAARFATLSPREQDVLPWLIRGSPNKVIAHQLGISARTVEIHRGRIMDKTAAASLADLVRLALAAGFTIPPA